MVVVAAAEVGGLARAAPLPFVVVFGIVLELFHVLLLVRIASALVGPHHLVVFDVVRQIDHFTFFSPFIFLLYITPAPSIIALFLFLFTRELIIAFLLLLLLFTIFNPISFVLFLDFDSPVRLGCSRGGRGRGPAVGRGGCRGGASGSLVGRRVAPRRG
jgi:hypothetical protein